MRIDELWSAMESEGEGRDVWLTRSAVPQSGCPLLVAFNGASHRRAMVIPAENNELPVRSSWPKCRGLDFIILHVASERHWGVAISDEQYSDVFTALVTDIAQRLTLNTTRADSIREFIGRLYRWQRFLTVGAEGLSESRQRGLYGELNFLASFAVPEMSPTLAIEAWKAPSASHQDFQFAGGAVEVKTTSAKQPQAVTITSERQLDDTGISKLFLHIAVLDVREGGTSREGTETLPQIVSRIRTMLSADQAARDLFDDRLLETQYLDADAWRYETNAYSIRKLAFYQVREGFPRIVEKDLNVSVGSVSYQLSLAGCEEFAVKESVVSAALSDAATRRH